MTSSSFRKISTQLFMALMSVDLTRAGYKVILVVIHFTLGYKQRTEAPISLTTFQNLTKLSRPSVKQALRLLRAKNILYLIKKANNRESTTYGFNTDFTLWRMGKVDLPTKGKSYNHSRYSKTYPPDVKNLPSRGKVPTPVTTHIKKKENYIKKTIAPPETPLFGEGVSTQPHHEFNALTPRGKAGADSLTNDQVVLPGEDRATLESDLSAPGSPSGGYRKRIADYLREHGPAAIKTISQATGIQANSVKLILHNDKGKIFRHFNLSAYGV